MSLFLNCVMLHRIGAAHYIVPQVWKLSRNIQRRPQEITLFIDGIDIRNGKLVVEPPSFNRLRMCNAIPEAFECIAAVVYR